jgi:hypothetical protein
MFHYGNDGLEFQIGTACNPAFSAFSDLCHFTNPAAEESSAEPERGPVPSENRAAQWLKPAPPQAITTPAQKRNTGPH